ncbi:hypothetical protein KGY71_05995 [Candidatus Bipolaricaulota bacterium]|nr:hypothetical protein [Candidatus Bipolaricaulota bacterium]
MTKKSKSGWVVVKHEPAPTPELPDVSELMSQQLGLSELDAKKIVQKRGKRRSFEALEARSNFLHRIKLGLANPSPVPAARQGSLPVTSINHLSPDAFFKLHIQGPRGGGLLRDSTLYVQVVHPKTEQPISGIPANITIADENGEAVLVDTLDFDEDQGMYVYKAGKDSNWMVDTEDLEPGNYSAYVDVGDNLQHVILPISLSEDMEMGLRD